MSAERMTPGEAEAAIAEMIESGAAPAGAKLGPCRVTGGAMCLCDVAGHAAGAVISQVFLDSDGAHAQAASVEAIDGEVFLPLHALTGDATLTALDGARLYGDVLWIDRPRGESGATFSYATRDRENAERRVEVAVSVAPENIDAPIDAHRGSPFVDWREPADQIETQLAALRLTPRGQATHRAIASGAWSDPSVWEHQTPPSPDAWVHIPLGCDVVYDVDTALPITTLRIDGALSFATDRDTLLCVETVVVTRFGRLLVGAPFDPVSEAATAQIRFAKSDEPYPDPFGLRLGLIAFGAVEVHGAPKQPHMKINGRVAAGDVSLALVDAPKGWRQGDKVVLTGTRTLDREMRDLQDEIRTILGIDGDTLRFAAPLSYAHKGPRPGFAASVANISRNVVIESEAPDTPERRAYVLAFNGATLDLRYAMFRDLGRRAVGQPRSPNAPPVAPSPNRIAPARAALSFHGAAEAGDAPAQRIDGCVVFGAATNAVTHHGGRALIRSTIVYAAAGASFLATTGDETGVWMRNLAVGGVGAAPGPQSSAREPHFEQGVGYCLHGRGVRLESNIAASQSGPGFLFRSQEAAELRDHPRPIGGVGDRVEDGGPLIQGFHGNEAFAVRIGLEVWESERDRRQRQRKLLQNFTAWGVQNGVAFNVASHFLLRDAVLISRPPMGREIGPNNKAGSSGVLAGSRIVDLHLKNVEAYGFHDGLRATGGAYEFDGAVQIDGLSASETIARLVNLSGNPKLLVEADVPFDDAPSPQFARQEYAEPPTPDADIALDDDAEDFLSHVDSADAKDTTEPAALEGYFQLPDGAYAVVVQEIVVDRWTGDASSIEVASPIDDDSAIDRASFFGELDATQEGERWIVRDSAAPPTDIVAITPGATPVIYISDIGEDERISRIKAQMGALSALKNGWFRYTPPVGFGGQDLITYVIDDVATGGRVALGSVRLEIAAQSDRETAPEAIHGMSAATLEAAVDAVRHSGFGDVLPHVASTEIAPAPTDVAQPLNDAAPAQTDFAQAPTDVATAPQPRPSEAHPRAQRDASQSARQDTSGTADEDAGQDASKVARHAVSIASLRLETHQAYARAIGAYPLLSNEGEPFFGATLSANAASILDTKSAATPPPETAVAQPVADIAVDKTASHQADPSYASEASLKKAVVDDVAERLAARLAERLADRVVQRFDYDDAAPKEREFKSRAAADDSADSADPRHAVEPEETDIGAALLETSIALSLVDVATDEVLQRIRPGDVIQADAFSGLELALEAAAIGPGAHAVKGIRLTHVDASASHAAKPGSEGLAFAPGKHQVRAEAFGDEDAETTALFAENVAFEIRSAGQTRAAASPRQDQNSQSAHAPELAPEERRTNGSGAPASAAEQPPMSSALIDPALADIATSSPLAGLSSTPALALALVDAESLAPLLRLESGDAVSTDKLGRRTLALRGAVIGPDAKNAKSVRLSVDGGDWFSQSPGATGIVGPDEGFPGGFEPGEHTVRLRAYQNKLGVGVPIAERSVTFLAEDRIGLTPSLRPNPADLAFSIELVDATRGEVVRALTSDDRIPAEIGGRTDLSIRAAALDGERRGVKGLRVVHTDAGIGGADIARFVGDQGDFAIDALASGRHEIVVEAYATPEATGRPLAVRRIEIEALRVDENPPPRSLPSRRAPPKPAAEPPVAQPIDAAEAGMLAEAFELHLSPMSPNLLLLAVQPRSDAASSSSAASPTIAAALDRAVAVDNLRLVLAQGEILVPLSVQHLSGRQASTSGDPAAKEFLVVLPRELDLSLRHQLIFINGAFAPIDLSQPAGDHASTDAAVATLSPNATSGPSLSASSTDEMEAARKLAEELALRAPDFAEPRREAPADTMDAPVGPESAVEESVETDAEQPGRKDNVLASALDQALQTLSARRAAIHNQTADGAPAIAEATEETAPGSPRLPETSAEEDSPDVDAQEAEAQEADAEDADARETAAEDDDPAAIARAEGVPQIDMAPSIAKVGVALIDQAQQIGLAQQTGLAADGDAAELDEPVELEAPIAVDAPAHVSGAVESVGPIFSDESAEVDDRTISDESPSHFDENPARINEGLSQVAAQPTRPRGFEAISKFAITALGSALAPIIGRSDAARAPVAEPEIHATPEDPALGDQAYAAEEAIDSTVLDVETSGDDAVASGSLAPTARDSAPETVLVRPSSQRDHRFAVIEHLVRMYSAAPDYFDGDGVFSVNGGLTTPAVLDEAFAALSPQFALQREDGALISGSTEETTELDFQDGAAELAHCYHFARAAAALAEALFGYDPEQAADLSDRAKRAFDWAELERGAREATVFDPLHMATPEIVDARQSAAIGLYKLTGNDGFLQIYFDIGRRSGYPLSHFLYVTLDPDLRAVDAYEAQWTETQLSDAAEMISHAIAMGEPATLDELEVVVCALDATADPIFLDALLVGLGREAVIPGAPSSMDRFDWVHLQDAVAGIEPLQESAPVAFAWALLAAELAYSDAQNTGVQNTDAQDADAQDVDTQDIRDTAAIDELTLNDDGVDELDNQRLDDAGDAEEDARFHDDSTFRPDAPENAEAPFEADTPLEKIVPFHADAPFEADDPIVEVEVTIDIDIGLRQPVLSFPTITGVAAASETSIAALDRMLGAEMTFAAEMRRGWTVSAASVLTPDAEPDLEPAPAPEREPEPTPASEPAPEAVRQTELSDEGPPTDAVGAAPADTAVSVQAPTAWEPVAPSFEPAVTAFEEPTPSADTPIFVLNGATEPSPHAMDANAAAEILSCPEEPPQSHEPGPEPTADALDAAGQFAPTEDNIAFDAAVEHFESATTTKETNLAPETLAWIEEPLEPAFTIADALRGVAAELRNEQPDELAVELDGVEGDDAGDDESLDQVFDPADAALSAAADDAHVDAGANAFDADDPPSAPVDAGDVAHAHGAAAEADATLDELLGPVAPTTTANEEDQGEPTDESRPADEALAIAKGVAERILRPLPSVPLNLFANDDAAEKNGAPTMDDLLGSDAPSGAAFEHAHSGAEDDVEVAEAGLSATDNRVGLFDEETSVDPSERGLI